MTRPTVSDLAEQLYDELGVTQPADEQLDWPFLIFLAGIAAGFGQLSDIVRDTDDGPGWSILLDPERCPTFALPWLAQFAGIKLTAGLTDDEHRDEIMHPPSFARGTKLAMRESGARYLTGTKYVGVFEREESDPYQIEVVTRVAETPDADVVEAALRAQKPAGLILTYETVLGTTWVEATSTWGAATVTWAEALTNPV